MMRALWTAGSGMVAQQANVDVISNNLANVNTTGFKKNRAEFEDLMYQTIRAAGSTTGPDSNLPAGVQMGHGAKLVATTKMYTQGSFQSTGNELDMTIAGDGFFQITMPDGTLAYTRNGAFQRDANGRIVNSEGYPIEPAITIPTTATNVMISQDGRVTATVPGQTAAQDLGQLQLARFVNPPGLSALGSSLFVPTDASGDAVVSNPTVDGAGGIQQKYLEMSNVQVVDEMVNMIVAQRAYEMNSKAVTTADSMLEIAAQLKR